MATIVVAGSAKSVGKTTLLCGLIAALPERQWTAIKITSHAYGKTESIWEETTAGQRTDTERYLAAGARRALLVSATDAELEEAKMRALLVSDRDVLIESNRVLDWVRPDVCVAVVGGVLNEKKASFAAALRRADALVVAAGRDPELTDGEGRPVFELADFSRISPAMVGWMRARLDGVKAG